jgi:hypothetical protein
MGPTTTEAPASHRTATLAIHSSPTLDKFRGSRDGGKPVVIVARRPGQVLRRYEVAIVEVGYDKATHHIAFRGAVRSGGIEIMRGQVRGEIFPDDSARSYMAYTAQTPPQ